VARPKGGTTPHVGIEYAVEAVSVLVRENSSSNYQRLVNYGDHHNE